MAQFRLIECIKLIIEFNKSLPVVESIFLFNVQILAKNKSVFKSSAVQNMNFHSEIAEKIIFITVTAAG